jgi:ClpP class serine protease
MPSDSIDHLSRGRIWTGQEALANGLIDSEGGVIDAIEYLASSEEIDRYRVMVYPEDRPLFLLPGRSVLGGIASLFTDGPEAAIQAVLDVNLPDDDAVILARLPFDIDIK